MMPTRFRFPLLIAMFCAAFLAPAVQAAEKPLTAAAQLRIQLPTVDHAALVEAVSTVRSRLIRRKQALQQVIAEREADGGDLLIAVLLPGGLLYAGYQQARLEQARDELARLDAEIKGYSGDLRTLRLTEATLAVARLP